MTFWIPLLVYKYLLGENSSAVAATGDDWWWDQMPPSCIYDTQKGKIMNAPKRSSGTNCALPPCPSSCYFCTFLLYTAIHTKITRILSKLIICWKEVCKTDHLDTERLKMLYGAQGKKRLKFIDFFVLVSCNREIL